MRGVRNQVLDLMDFAPLVPRPGPRLMDPRIVPRPLETLFRTDQVG